MVRWINLLAMQPWRCSTLPLTARTTSIKRFVLHGPFLDITVHSSDRYIREASDLRIRQACEIGLELGVRGVIVHTNFIPNFYQKTYREGWVDRNEEYFRKLLEDFPQLWIYIKSMFDEEPECLVKLAQRMAG